MGRIYTAFVFGNVTYDLTKQFLVGLEVASWKTLWVDQRPGDARLPARAGPRRAAPRRHRVGHHHLEVKPKQRAGDVDEATTRSFFVGLRWTGR